MFQSNNAGADTPTVSPSKQPLPDYQYETVNHTLFGSLTAIRKTILLLHTLKYAEPND